MKKTNLTRSLLAACSIVALSAVMYGCSSSGEDEERSRATMAEEMLAALAAAAGLPDGTALTPEHIQQAAQALADSQAEVARLTGELNTANDRVVELLADLATANASIADLTQDLADANAEVTRLEGELSDANDEVTRLTGELSTANADVTRLTGELATANAENSRLTDELGMANMQIAGLMDDLAMANSQIESLGDDLAQVTSERDDARQDLAQAREDLAAARMQNMMDAETIAGLEGQVSALEGQVEMKDMQIATMTGQIGDLKNTIDGLEAQITSKDAEISGLTSQIEGKDAEIDNLEAEIGAKNTEIDGLKADITTKDIEIGDLQNTIDDLNGQIDDKNAEIAGLEDDIDGLNDDIDDLNDEIDAKNAEIIAANAEITRLKEQIESAGGEADHFRARQLAREISPLATDHATQTDANLRDGIFDPLPAILMDRPDDTTTTENEARDANDQILAHIKADSGGSHVIDEDEDSQTPSAYTPGSAPSIGGDWRGRSFEDPLPGGSSNIVYAYSDIDEPTSETFGDAYGMLGPGAPDPASYTVEQQDEYMEAVDAYRKSVGSFDFTDEVKPGTAKYNGAPTVGDDTPNEDPPSTADMAGSAVEFWKLAVSSAFPPALQSGGQQRYVFYGRGGASDPTDTNGQMFAGTFDGVSGMFECVSAAGCAVQRTDTGALESFVRDGQSGITTTVAEWRFIANSADAMVRMRRPDGDYITFGWWLEKPDAPEGQHKFAPFYAGRDQFMSANVAALEGEATYEGQAAGKYAKRKRGTNEAESGIFRADASLMANFGGNPDDDVTDSTAGTVSGTIDNFVDASSGGSLGDWNVVLAMSGDIPTTGDPGAVMVSGDIVNGDSRADGRAWYAGAWEAAFYGNNGTGNTDYPGSVAGQFHAHWGTAEQDDMYSDPDTSVVGDVGYVGVGGSFGAHYVEPAGN